MVECIVDDGRPTDGGTDEHRAVDTGVAKHRIEIGHVRERLGRRAAAPVPALVVTDGAVLARKCGHLVVPHAAIADAGMCEHHSVALPGVFDP